jgi:outer membrane lipoprotein SlyB
VIYTVNLTDGSAVVNLSVSPLRIGNTPTLYKNGDWYEIQQPVFTTSITYGYEIPLNVDSIRTPSLLVGDIVSKAVFGGVAGAMAGNYVGAAIGAVGGAVAGAAGGPETTYSVGALTANSNVMEDFEPKLIRTIVKDQSGDISAAVGAPSGKVVRVGDASGYLKAAMVYGTPSTTMQHTDEIVGMLKEGIYIS